MTVRTRYMIAAALLLLLMAGPFVVSAVVAWAEATLDHRAIFADYFHRILPIGAGLTVLALLLGFLILNRLFRQYVTGMAAMVERLTVMLVSNRDLRLEEQGPPELRQVIAAMNRLADQRDHKIDDIEKQIDDQQSMYTAISERSKSGTDLELPLSTLVYTAFDTETTGLQPSGGDEIIQIGALRVENGSLCLDDRFEKLIDPGRAINPESLAVHGISDDMVRGSLRSGQCCRTSTVSANNLFCWGITSPLICASSRSKSGQPALFSHSRYWIRCCCRRSLIPTRNIPAWNRAWPCWESVSSTVTARFQMQRQRHRFF